MVGARPVGGLAIQCWRSGSDPTINLKVVRTRPDGSPPKVETKTKALFAFERGVSIRDV